MISRSVWLPGCLALAIVAISGLTGCGGSEEVAVGSAAPDFTLPDALGGEVALSSFEGQQPVLLYFHMADG